MKIDARIARITSLHARMEKCHQCPHMVGPVVHGPAMVSEVLVVGQAPGPHEGKIGRPFAWTAGKTLFRWLFEAGGVDEPRVRERLYFSAVARCFPGKAKGGGDRVPDEKEISNCRTWLEAEVSILKPALIIPVGALAIRQVLDHQGPLKDIIGTVKRVNWLGVSADVIALPHPSGASTWHRMEPGKTLLQKAVTRLVQHSAWKRTFVDPRK